MKRNRMKKTVLLLIVFVSLLLNAFFIGLGYKYYQIRQKLAPSFHSEISSSIRSDFMALLKSDRIDIQSARNALMQARAQVRAEMSADTIDKDSLREAFKNVRIATTNLQEVLHQALLEKMNDEL